ncbi:MAG: hypothetical protein QW745_00745 [Thermoplasmata archaeon]
MINVNGIKFTLSNDKVQEISDGIIPSGVQERLIMNKFQLLPILAEYIPRKIWISKRDGIYVTLHNGDEGVIKIHYVDEKNPEKSTLKVILRFIGQIGPVVKIKSDKIGKRYNINGTEDENSVDDFVTFTRQKLALTSPQVQLLRQAIDSFLLDETRKGDISEYLSFTSS